MKLKKTIFIFLLLFLVGCTKGDEDFSGLTEDTVNVIEENSSESESIEYMENGEPEGGSVETTDSDENRFDGSSTIFIGGYSKPCLLEERISEADAFDKYEDLINKISTAFEESEIEEVLYELSYKVKPLSNAEIQEVFEKDQCGLLEEYARECSNEKGIKTYWYLIEQNEEQIDVVVQNIYENGDVDYYTFECIRWDDGNMWADIGMPAISDTEEHYFIPDNDYIYLCTPRRDAQGEIEGVAIHVYNMENLIGGIIYIENKDDITVTTYTIGTGKYGDPIPSYLLEEKNEWKTESEEDISNAKNKSNGTIEVSVERIDKSIKNQTGDVIAVVYYEKPVVYGDSEVVGKINAFFEKEVSNFLNGKGTLTEETENYYEYFEEGVKSLEEIYGEKELVENPLHYVVETRITHLDSEILSVFQMSDVQLGTLEWSYNGCTFDLSSGELLPITELIDIKPEEMKKILQDGTKDSWNEVSFEELMGNNYKVTYGSTTVDTQWEYFYDGESFYLIDNWAQHDGYLYKWNGKWGSDYELQDMQYLLSWPDSNLTWKE